MPVSKERVERTIANLVMLKGRFKPLSREYGHVTGAIHLLEDFDNLVNELYEKLGDYEDLSDDST